MADQASEPIKQSSGEFVPGASQVLKTPEGDASTGETSPEPLTGKSKDEIPPEGTSPTVPSEDGEGESPSEEVPPKTPSAHSAGDISEVSPKDLVDDTSPEGTPLEPSPEDAKDGNEAGESSSKPSPKASKGEILREETSSGSLPEASKVEMPPEEAASALPPRASGGHVPSRKISLKPSPNASKGDVSAEETSSKLLSGASNDNISPKEAPSTPSPEASGRDTPPEKTSPKPSPITSKGDISPKNATSKSSSVSSKCDIAPKELSSKPSSVASKGDIPPKEAISKPSSAESEHNISPEPTPPKSPPKETPTVSSSPAKNGFQKGSKVDNASLTDRLHEEQIKTGKLNRLASLVPGRDGEDQVVEPGSVPQWHTVDISLAGARPLSRERCRPGAHNCFDVPSRRRGRALTARPSGQYPEFMRLNVRMNEFVAASIIEKLRLKGLAAPLHSYDGRQLPSSLLAEMVIKPKKKRVTDRYYFGYVPPPTKQRVSTAFRRYLQQFMERHKAAESDLCFSHALEKVRLLSELSGNESSLPDILAQVIRAEEEPGFGTRQLRRPQSAAA